MASTSLRQVLPQVFAAGAETGPLAAVVAAADGMHQPVSDVLDQLHSRFDPMLAPDAMVCYLASWVDLDWLTLPETPTRSRSTLPGGAAPLRDLLVASADLAARRGTAGGITSFLELATRRDGFVVEDAGGFHLRVHLPPGAGDIAEVVERIIAVIKPAHITSEVLDAGAEPDPVDPAGAEPVPPTPTPDPAPPTPAEPAGADPVPPTTAAEGHS